MIKAIEVRDFRTAQLFESSLPWAAISIVSVVGGNPRLHTENRVGILNMVFADVDFVRPDIDASMVFDKAKAIRILDFVSEMWSQVECFMIHCHAGMSRSPAVAAAIECIYHGKGADRYWFKVKTPNMLVYRTILEAHQLLKELEQSEQLQQEYQSSAPEQEHLE